MKPSSAWVPLALVTSLLAGRATTAPSSGCDGWRPIRPAASDVASASDDLVEQVLAHNRHGAATCGWKP